MHFGHLGWQADRQSDRGAGAVGQYSCTVRHARDKPDAVDFSQPARYTEPNAY